MAAAFVLVLLPFVVLGEGVRAQNTDLRTITNVAQASWEFRGVSTTGESNEVTIQVSETIPEIRALRPADDGLVVEYQPGRCALNGSIPQAPPGTPPAPMQSISLEPTPILRPGQTLFFEVTAAVANTDPASIDEMDAIITTSAGDLETVRISETGNNTGIFVGEIATTRRPPAATQEDCVLSITDGDEIEVGATLPGDTTIIVRTDVEVLADPFGVVFDSETGQPVDGARVTLIDDATGLPATVFAEDGVTPWPSTIISGQLVTDGAGGTFQLDTGEFWFPLTSLGRYRLIIEPPDPYSAPSVVSPEELALLTRPDGQPFAIEDGSYGGTFDVDSTIPRRIDIPLDRPSLEISIAKSVSRQSALPGDIVFYTINVANTDPARVKRNVLVGDTPSRWLRLRSDSFRIDGEEASDAATIAPDGSTFTVAIGDLEGGEARRVTYAMSVRPDAPPGRVLNDAEVRDSLGRVVNTSAFLDIERDGIADRMTIIGRVTAGSCELGEPRQGIPGVRVMLEDGSFAITDADGRYHFEGVVPGTHVVQVSRMTLPEGGKFIDCARNTRSAGSAISRFVIGQGGSLAVADFHATVPDGALAAIADFAETTPGGSIARSIGAAIEEGAENTNEIDELSDAEGAQTAAELAPTTDWLALGDGPDGWLTPEVGHNPRVPAIRVAIRHRKGQKIVLKVDGEEVSPLTFEGTQTPERGRFAVSIWRGVPLGKEKTELSADIINSFGEINQAITREVFFTNRPAKAELVLDQSNLVADGRTRPVVAVRILDRNNRPMREGISGEFTLSAPYESAEQIDRQQLNQLTGLLPSSARWVVEGSDGIARIELAPTMVSGSLRLDFRFVDEEIVRTQELEAWIEPGDIEWTLIGLAEGSLGARTVADSMQRTGRFESDLGDRARVALYAKGRVLGKYLVTLAYDSAKQREDQRVLGAIDPQAYYTVFADASSRRFDAASRENLYVRIESSTFYALYGDFQTGFDQTQLARYNRTATGIKGEMRIGQVKALGFAAEVSSRLQRDEIQGQGITGPYRLGSRRILPNSERVTLEVRDRFRSEAIVTTRELTRFIDYDLDTLSGTITFAEPVLSRDFDLNPQFIVIEYEVDGLGESELNAGLRTDWTSNDGAVRLGANVITDRGDGARTDIGSLDLRARIGDETEIRAEVALSRSEGDTASGWLVEAQHRSGKLDLLAYARELDADYGVGQQNGAELGRRKFGVDGRVLLTEDLSVVASAWQDDSLSDSSRRRAAQVQLGYTANSTDLRAGLSHFADRLADGSRNKSTVLEGGVTQRLFNNDLELSATSSIALDDAESVDLPARHRLGARYAITNDVKLVGLYEIADGEDIDARTLRGGFEVTPWQGGRVLTSLGQQDIGELGNRSFAAFGLAQSLQVSPELTIDATVDGSRTLNRAPDVSDVVNPAQPVASGGQLSDGTLFEDFTAVTLGAAWRKDRWSATARGEYRDGEFANRKGATIGAIRQLGDGSIVGSGAIWTSATAENGAKTEIFDASVAFAHRPDASEFAMLGKLEFRSDSVTDAIAGEAGAAGRSVLTVDGHATSRRLISSVSTNWSPIKWDRDDQDRLQQHRPHEFGLFLAARYNFDEFEGTEFSGTTLFAGLDTRIGIGERFELGGVATVRTNLEDDVTSFSYGPQIGFNPADGMLVTVGYNVEGFRDGDFSAARNTDKGVFVTLRAKFDTDTFSFLGLGR